MSSAYATKLAEAFSNKLLKEMYDISVLPQIVNRDYEGEINAVGSKLNMLNFDRISEKDYTPHTPLTRDGLFENNSQLVIEKYKSFYWGEYTIDKWLSYIKEPHPTVMTQKADERNRNMDLYALGLYTKIATGNRVGNDYTTGTVTVDATTGLVTGSATTFTSSMVGRGFKATGHTKWYRVKTFSSTTSMVIEDDLDDITSAYTGGAIGAGATFIVEAVTPLQITTSNLLQSVGKLKVRLNTQERFGKSAVPATGRFLIVPPEFSDLLTRATGVVLSVPDVFTNLIQKGFLGMLQGFMIYESNRLTGDNTNGFRVIAGHQNWLTFAEKQLQASIEEEIIGDFGTGYKDLFVYGGKVPDKRRGFAAEGYWLF